MSCTGTVFYIHRECVNILKHKLLRLHKDLEAADSFTTSALYSIRLLTTSR